MHAEQKRERREASLKAAEGQERKLELEPRTCRWMEKPRSVAGWFLARQTYPAQESVCPAGREDTAFSMWSAESVLYRLCDLAAESYTLSTPGPSSRKRMGAPFYRRQLKQQGPHHHHHAHTPFNVQGQ